MTTQAEQTIETLLAQADAAWGERYSAVLYGSLARNEYREGQSDVNLLLVAEPLTPEGLRALAPALDAFAGAGNTPPLLFDAAEWRRAADVFPVEIADMRLGYRVLRGADPVAGQKIRPADLRRALEQEWRGKVLRLRQLFAAAGDRADALGAAAAGTAASARVLLRVTLVLAGDEVPADDPGLARAAAARCGFDPAPVAAVLAHRREAGWRCGAGEFQGYLAAVEAATRFVDHFQTEAR